ncbi:MAG: glycosyl hydrolase family 28-related protein [Xanthobacteraceae bacterium]
MARSPSIYSWCGTSATNGFVTASFISGGQVVQTVTTGTQNPSTNACHNFNVPLPTLPVPANALGDEFVGPFASWANLKRDFGAVGNGVADDTQAIQSALNAVSKSGNSPVLYIPAGTYLVTQTVTIKSALSISVIGADPNTTTLKWGGASGGILFHIDGVAYSRFDRITFEGNGTAGVLVDQSLDSQGQYFDTGNEYADDFFQNAGIGIQGGQYGQGAAESSVLRSNFLNNTTAGIILKNFNALDWWIWYSYFQNNKYGITNNPGAGNFHAFNNVFNSSTTSDLELLNTGIFNFRDNFSINSNMFLNEDYFYTNAAVTRLQGNTVITPAGNDCNGCAVVQGNMGPMSMTDNVFVSPPNASWPSVIIHSLNPPDCLSVGNAFTQNNALVCQSWPNLVNGRLIEQGDQVVSAASINQTPPTLPGVLSNYNRQIFDVPVGSRSAAIQQAIQQATGYCGQRPIVHLQYGSYSLDQTVTIPANCDIQLVGDGDQTALTWSGGSGPALVLQGPSRAILRDFHLSAGSAVGIDVQGADQPGSRVYMQQPRVSRGSVANVFVDSLDYTNVELQNFNLTSTATAPATTGVSLKVVGGPLAQQGNPQYGRTNLFAGSTSDNYISYQASQGASLLVRDAWYEGANVTTFAQVSDSSNVTIEGSRIALPANNGDAIQIKNLTCDATTLSSAPDSDVNIGGSGNGNAWVVANNFGTASSYFSNLSSGVVGAFNLNRYSSSNGSTPITDMTATPNAAFISATLAQSRTAHPSQILDLPAGVTDVRFYRVSVDLGTIGIHLER